MKTGSFVGRVDKHPPPRHSWSQVEEEAKTPHGISPTSLRKKPEATLDHLPIKYGNLDVFVQCLDQDKQKYSSNKTQLTGSNKKESIQEASTLDDSCYPRVSLS